MSFYNGLYFILSSFVQVKINPSLLFFLGGVGGGRVDGRVSMGGAVSQLHGKNRFI